MSKKQIRTILIFLISGFFLQVWPADKKETPATDSAPVSSNENKDYEVTDFLPVTSQNEAKALDIETEYFKIDFSSRGGHITAFRHKDPENKLKSNVDIVINDPFYFNIYKSPASEHYFKTSNYKLQRFENKDFVSVKATIDAGAKTARGVIPVSIIKTYKFARNTHYWEFYWEIQNKSANKLSIPELYFIPLNDIGPSLTKDEIGSSARYLKDFYYVNDDYNSVPIEASRGGFFWGKAENIGDVKEVEGNVEYFGMGSRFMILTVQPVSSASALTVIINNHKKKEMHVHMSPIEVEPKASSKYEFLLYTGPKVNRFFTVTPEMVQKNPKLKLNHKELYKAFDFGVTAPIRDLIVVILKGLYSIIPNYGVAIILLVIALKLVFFPLNQTQAKSMKKMQDLQPKIKEINEKYKKNPQERQRKTIELYKINKVNPMGGCLPILIQAPIFIALISAFSDSYELWGSPFITGWINDLSKPDTVYTFAQTLPLIGGININILPIIMAVSQVLQTQFTMVSTDKNQKIMMQVLPVVMVLFFWNFPSGAVLYWVVYNILSVLQQLYTNKILKKSNA